VSGKSTDNGARLALVLAFAAVHRIADAWWRTAADDGAPSIQRYSLRSTKKSGR
jgi:hypothetical protein